MLRCIGKKTVKPAGRLANDVVCDADEAKEENQARRSATLSPRHRALSEGPALNGSSTKASAVDLDDDDDLPAPRRPIHSQKSATLSGGTIPPRGEDYPDHSRSGQFGAGNNPVTAFWRQSRARAASLTRRIKSFSASRSQSTSRRASRDVTPHNEPEPESESEETPTPTQNKSRPELLQLFNGHPSTSAGAEKSVANDLTLGSSFSQTNGTLVDIDATPTADSEAGNQQRFFLESTRESQPRTVVNTDFPGWNKAAPTVDTDSLSSLSTQPIGRKDTNISTPGDGTGSPSGLKVPGDMVSRTPNDPRNATTPSPPPDEADAMPQGSESVSEPAHPHATVAKRPRFLQEPVTSSGQTNKGGNSPKSGQVRTGHTLFSFVCHFTK